jgi:hypothetical protein
MENKVRKKKSPAQVLCVTINRKQIFEKNSTETFLACIKMLGVEKVAALTNIIIEGLPLVVPTKDHRLQMRQLDKHWFVCTHMPTKSKKSFLERIAKQMGIKIKVEILNEIGYDET